MSPIMTASDAERTILARLSETPGQWLGHGNLLPRRSARQIQVVKEWIAAGIIEEDPNNADRPDYLKQYRLADPAQADAELADGLRRERVARLYAARERARETYQGAQGALAALHETFTRAAAWDCHNATPTSVRDMTHDLAALGNAIENCSTALVGVYSAGQGLDSEERRYGPIPDHMRPDADAAP